MKKLLIALTCSIGMSLSAISSPITANSTIKQSHASCAAGTVTVQTPEAGEVELPEAVIFTLASKYAGAKIVSTSVLEHGHEKLYRVVLELPDRSETAVYLNENGEIKQ